MIYFWFVYPKEWTPRNSNINGAERTGIYWTVFLTPRWRWNESSTQAFIIIITVNKRCGINAWCSGAGVFGARCSAIYMYLSIPGLNACSVGYFTNMKRCDENNRSRNYNCIFKVSLAKENISGQMVVHEKFILVNH